MRWSKMAAQLLSEKQIQMPHLPEQIWEAAYRQELPIHHCQCHAEPPAKDLAALATKLLKVMKACAVVPKDKQNSAQKYKYASSDAILEKVNPAFCEAGLATVCSLEVLDRQPRTTNTGSMWELVSVRARITIIDSETGSSIETEGIGQGYDSGDKAISKAQTQAKKYALMLMLNISTGDDPENDSQTDRVQEPTAICKKCKSQAALTNAGEDSLAGPYKEYTCKCGNVFRAKA
jgi:ERF superfamily